MSKSTTATASKIPSQLPGAWAKGPPLATSTSRSQSPAPTTPIHPTHSRRPSTLGQGVPVKDGVSVPRGNVGAVKQQGKHLVITPPSHQPRAQPELFATGSSAVTFGSIDDVSAPISSSPAAVPPIKSEGVKTFGSVDVAASGHVNGKSSISSRPTLVAPTPSSSAPSPAVATPTTASKPKFDINKLFQNPTSAPPSHPPSDTSSPATRTSNLPSQSQSSFQQQGQAPPTPSQPSFGSTAAPFIPNAMRSQQNSGPGGPGPGPRSPSYPRSMQNGNGHRPQGGPNGGPSQHSAGLSSPRLPPPSVQQSGMPPPPSQMQPQMPPWGYYPYPDQHYIQPYASTWYPMPGQPQHHPPHHPQGPQHSGVPMSPRNHPPPLPGTPTQSHAVAAPIHSPHPPPAHAHSHSTSNSISGLTSPPPTPSGPAIGNARLNANSNTFVPGGRSKVTMKRADGTPVNPADLKTASPATTNGALPPFSGTNYRQGSPSANGTGPPQRTSSVRLETEEQRKKRVADAEEVEKAKQRAEEKLRVEKEEKLRKEKEAEERKKREEEEREQERLRKEAEEKERIRLDNEKKERERVRKEEEEKERLRLEEERKLKEEEEEKERIRLAEEAKEQERLRKEEERRNGSAEAEAAAAALAAAEAAAAIPPPPPPPADAEEGEVPEEGEESPPPSTTEDLKEEVKDKGVISPALPSALATARHIDDLKNVAYPEGIQSPKVELNVNAKDGKFRYDRDFLLQFMKVCTDKPDMLPPLDVIGLEPDQASMSHSMSRGGSGRHRQGSGPIPVTRQASMGLGFGPSVGFGKSGSSSGFSMGNFATPLGASKLNSEERFNMSNSGRSASVSGPLLGRPAPMQRTASQGGPGMPNNRTRSKRGEKRPESNKPGGNQQGHGSGFGNHGQMSNTAMSMEPIAPLQATANRWDRKAVQNVDPDSPEIVDRKVKALLNKLTMEKFDSISDQIISWANRSEKEKDGRTLIQVIRLVFEKATDEATWSEMYARLCRKMMEKISPSVQDDGIRNSEGKPIAGGGLRARVGRQGGHCCRRCDQGDGGPGCQGVNDKNKEGETGDEIVLYSDEYYAAQKAKRQGLGLIKFIGELFKLQMLTERIMHECLLTTVGALLDVPKARAHMDVYFQRMKELTKSQNVSSRMQFMLQDVIELRERKWVTRNLVAAPTTIAQIHEAAAKEKAAQDKESYQRQINMSRGGSRRGGDRNDPSQQIGPDGWAVAGNNSGPPRPPPKAGDLSNFGKISKPTPMTFGPTSVFSKKEGKRESLSRTSSSSNMFSMLSQGSEVATPDGGSAKGSHTHSRKTSVDISHAGAPEPAPQRKRIVLQPRSKPADAETAPTPEPEASSDEVQEMSAEEADKKIAEDSKELFAVRNLDEAEVYFTNLPAQHHSRLIAKLASSGVESKAADAQLVAEFFGRAASKGLCSAAAFEDGLAPTAEIIDDIAIDAPKAFELFAQMVKAAGLDEERRTRLASKSLDSDRLLPLLS
ncbi:hypothetical protein BD779DRAFT_1670764 [Infundibulicybe gibba]|nr:hypothetical protein BD779DRAFT_1670764 [Infundibulicybe gibba]